MSLIPATVNGLQSMEVISALQKHIRRGEEREAMACACEMLYSKPNLRTMFFNRLKVILYEDCDTIPQPWLVPYVTTTIDNIKVFLKQNAKTKIDSCRLMLGALILQMARCKKSRLANHFCLAVGVAIDLGEPPNLPDYAFCMHTSKGRRMKRGVEHFRTEGARLENTSDLEDTYEDEAYEEYQRWQKSLGKDRGDDKQPQETMFD